LGWQAQTGRAYQVEYSPDILAWFAAPGGEVVASGLSANWTDTGASNAPVRFYRVFQLGSP
ncbi:MAG TPA: hypothetical protein VH598_06680, partial [Verrucomicrobiae bacterium]|nr:hypothetical protein [Verrucomicrobiae bacterium]